MLHKPLISNKIITQNKINWFIDNIRKLINKMTSDWIFTTIIKQDKINYRNKN